AVLRARVAVAALRRRRAAAEERLRLASPARAARVRRAGVAVLAVLVGLARGLTAGDRQRVVHAAPGLAEVERADVAVAALEGARAAAGDRRVVARAGRRVARVGGAGVAVVARRRRAAVAGVGVERRVHAPDRRARVERAGIVVVASGRARAAARARLVATRAA